MTILLILLAGALGTVLRYLVSLSGSVWAVLIVNVVGSFIAGLAISMSGDMQAIVAVGFCGGLTTFSTFSVRTVELAVHGKWSQAVSAVVGNVLLGLTAAAFGAGLLGA